MFNITPELIKQVAFYGFSTLSILAAIMVISSKHSVRAALFLVLTFVSTSAVWLLLESEFLAITLVLVYVGAVMVLFLFVVMMLDVDKAKKSALFTRYLPVGLFIGTSIIAALIFIVTLDTFKLIPIPEPRLEGYSHIVTLGELLYSDYLLPFELAGVILLVAIIAAITLTFRGTKRSRKQNPALQVNVNKSDRLKIISFDK